MTSATTTDTAQLARLLDQATSEAVQQLRGTSTDALLTTFAALTHRMHRLERKTGHLNRSDRDALRAQRDLVRAELLRRTGDL